MCESVCFCVAIREYLLIAFALFSIVGRMAAVRGILMHAMYTRKQRQIIF